MFGGSGLLEGVRELLVLELRSWSFVNGTLWRVISHFDCGRRRLLEAAAAFLESEIISCGVESLELAD